MKEPPEDAGRTDHPFSKNGLLSEIHGLVRFSLPEGLARTSRHPLANTEEKE